MRGGAPSEPMANTNHTGPADVRLLFLRGRFFTFEGACAVQQVRQCVVALVARVFENRAGRSSPCQFAFPWARKSSGVIDFKPILHRICIDQTEALYDVQISI